VAARAVAAGLIVPPGLGLDGEWERRMAMRLSHSPAGGADVDQSRNLAKSVTVE